MARQRRGGGFKTPELRGTLGTLLRTTIQQAGVVRDAARDVSSAVRAKAVRVSTISAPTAAVTKPCAELGEVVRSHPPRRDRCRGFEARAIVDHLDELDASETTEAASRDSTHHATTHAQTVRPIAPPRKG
jgi:hypothetical protein